MGDKNQNSAVNVPMGTAGLPACDGVGSDHGDRTLPSSDQARADAFVPPQVASEVLPGGVIDTLLQVNSVAPAPAQVSGEDKDDGQTTTINPQRFKIGTPNQSIFSSGQSATSGIDTEGSYELLTEPSYVCSGISRSHSSGGSTHSSQRLSNLSPFDPDSEGHLDDPVLKLLGDKTISSSPLPSQPAPSPFARPPSEGGGQDGVDGTVTRIGFPDANGSKAQALGYGKGGPLVTETAAVGGVPVVGGRESGMDNLDDGGKLANSPNHLIIT